MQSTGTSIPDLQEKKSTFFFWVAVEHEVFGLCLWANGHEKETPFMKKLRLTSVIIGLEE